MGRAPFAADLARDTSVEVDESPEQPDKSWAARRGWDETSEAASCRERAHQRREPDRRDRAGPGRREE